MEVYSPKSVQDAWDNHFAAFGGQDVKKILLDYTEDSVLTLYDFTTDKKQVFKGLKAIGEVFTGLFAQLNDLSTLDAPVVDVEEDPRQVFLIWRCPGCGFEHCTDTFMFDENFKITRQNVVVKTKA